MIVKSKKKFIIGLICLIVFFASVGIFAHIANAVSQANCEAPAEGFLKGMTKACYCDGVCDFCNFAQIGANIYVFLRTVSFFIMVGMIIWGGIMMMSAGASVKNYKSGWSIMSTAVIGFVLFVAVTLILNTFLIVVMGTSMTWQSFISGRLNCPNAISAVQ